MASTHLYLTQIMVMAGDVVAVTHERLTDRNQMSAYTRAFLWDSYWEKMRIPDHRNHPRSRMFARVLGLFKADFLGLWR